MNLSTSMGCQASLISTLKRTARAALCLRVSPGDFFREEFKKRATSRISSYYPESIQLIKPVELVELAKLQNILEHEWYLLQKSTASRNPAGVSLLFHDLKVVLCV